MELLERSANGCGLVPIECVYFEDRVIFLEGEITDEKALSIQKQLGELVKQGGDDVLLVINSPGGSIQAGLSVYDAIWSAPFKVHTYCPSEAYSMGAVIFACGSGERIMASHAKLMLHEPLVRGVKDGSASSIKAVSENLEKSRQTLCVILKSHTNRTEEELTEALSSDHYYTLEEALEFGLCDKKGGIDVLSSFGKRRILDGRIS